MTNLRNYVNLSVTNMPPVEMQGIKLSGFGQGNGLIGLPGDFTPPSRLVRAVAFSQSAAPVKTRGRGCYRRSIFLTNSIFLADRCATHHGQVHDDYTLWTSAADMANRRYFFHTYANRRIRMIDWPS